MIFVKRCFIRSFLQGYKSKLDSLIGSFQQNIIYYQENSSIQSLNFLIYLDNVFVGVGTCVRV